MAESPAAPPLDARPITLRDLAGMEVQRLAGVGPKTLTGLHHLGIESILDLVSHYPRRYLDRTRQATIRDLRAGEEGMVLATVQSIESRRVRGGRSMVMATIGDGTGRLRLSFFNQGWRVKQLPIGTEAVFHGKVDEFRGQRQMTNPVVDLIGTRTGRIIPVYPQSEKANLSTWELGDLVAQALRRCQPRGLAEPLPAWLRDRHGLVDRATALRGIHEPASMAEMAQARRRLVFDELLRIQVALVRAKRELERSALGIEHSADRGLLDRYLGRLPFPLTGAQDRAIAEIRSDMTRPLPMHRLLQGDVGAGKTVVAVATLLTAIEGGHQGALMAPTEVLAEQHAIGLRRDLAGLTVADREGGLFPERELRLALLTNRTTGAERTRVLTDLAAGTIDLVVGTHALIQSGVGFRSLGAVVIDEQHRFGVEQRAALRVANEDGRVPDVLVMTATPIPRTAAMTVYGDLDVSVLDELPPGRTPIVTSWARTDAEVDAVWELVRNEVAGGRQAYVVCPLIDESEKLEVASANEVFERLRAVDLAGLSVELLHGRMPSAAKESVMAAFRSGDHRDRGRRRCAQCNGHGDPRRRPVRHRAAAPVAGPRRPRQLCQPLRAGGGRADSRRGGPAGGPGAVDRRVRACRGRPGPARRGHDHGRAPEGAERPSPGVAAPRSRVGRPRSGRRLCARGRARRTRRASAAGRRGRSGVA